MRTRWLRALGDEGGWCTRLVLRAGRGRQCADPNGVDDHEKEQRAGCHDARKSHTPGAHARKVRPLCLPGLLLIEGPFAATCSLFASSTVIITAMDLESHLGLEREYPFRPHDCMERTTLAAPCCKGAGARRCLAAIAIGTGRGHQMIHALALLCSDYQPPGNPIRRRRTGTGLMFRSAPASVPISIAARETRCSGASSLRLLLLVGARTRERVYTGHLTPGDTTSAKTLGRDPDSTRDPGASSYATTCSARDILPPGPWWLRAEQ